MALYDKLSESNRFNKAKKLVSRTQKLLDTFAADIDNDHYRRVILESIIPLQFMDLKKRLNDTDKSKLLSTF